MVKHISQVWNLDVKGHSQFDFVDVNVLSDNLLFIDPSLIESSKAEWCFKANLTMTNYFDCFYKAYREKNDIKKHDILVHAGEINCTRLGYGQGDNGHGNTVEGLTNKFSILDPLASRINSISSAIDLPVLIPGFSKDGMSDMLTNILHEELSEFTLQQCKKWGQTPNAVKPYFTWDAATSSWKKVSGKECYITDKGKLLLVPKDIVQANYLISAEQYLRRIILSRMKEERAYTDSKGKTRYPSKKSIRDDIAKETPYWKHDFIVSYSEKHPNALEQYHRRIPEFYANRKLSDDELDMRIYIEDRT